MCVFNINEVKKKRCSLAVIPPMMLDTHRHSLRYRNESGLVLDPLAKNERHAPHPVLVVGGDRGATGRLLTSDDRPECTACRCPLTVKHFLLKCAEFSYIRRNYFTATSIKDLFDKTDNQLIVDFINDINFYHSL